MTILDFVRMSRHNAKLLLGCVLAGLLAAALYCALQPVQYRAVATGMVIAGSAGSVGDATAGQALAASRASSYTTLVNTVNVAKRTEELLGDPSIPVAGHISGDVVPGSIQFQVTATATNPQAAQRLADKALEATAVEAYNVETLNDPQVQARNKQVQEEAAKRAQEAAKAGQPIPQLTPDTMPTGSVVKLVPFTSASAPSTPFSPDWKRNLPIGALAGLILGYAIAFIRKSVDQRIRTVNEIEELTGAGALAVIPESKELAQQREGGDMRKLGVASESIRQLRTNLRFVSVDKQPRTFVVTSANPGEGKSTVSANLARVMAESGTKTLLVDADLRRPMQSRQFGFDGEVGLTQVLAGTVDATDAMESTDNPNLFVLPAGRIPPNPSELVGSHRMAALIDALGAEYTVIIDAPPLLPVTDAGLLAAASDGAILVTRVNRTFREQVRLCAKRLGQVNATLLGTVVNRAPQNGVGAVVYGYGYGYGAYESTYYYSEDGEKKQRAGAKKRGRGKRTATTA